MIRRGLADVSNRERVTVLAACFTLCAFTVFVGQCGQDPAPADNMEQLQHERTEMRCQNAHALGYSTPDCPGNGRLP